MLRLTTLFRNPEQKNNHRKKLQCNNRKIPLPVGATKNKNHSYSSCCLGHNVDNSYRPSINHCCTLCPCVVNQGVHTPLVKSSLRPQQQHSTFSAANNSYRSAQWLRHIHNATFLLPEKGSNSPREVRRAKKGKGRTPTTYQSWIDGWLACRSCPHALLQWNGIYVFIFARKGKDCRNERRKFDHAEKHRWSDGQQDGWILEANR